MMYRSPKLALSLTVMMMLGLIGSGRIAPLWAEGEPPEVLAEDSQKQSTPLPPPPDTPPPPGNRTPGGGLSGEEETCLEKQQPLTALTPVNGQGATLSEQPTFWFYMPYRPEEILKGEFSLVTRDETQRLYRTSFKLPDTPGWVSISWPDSVDFSLLENNYYHWYVNLYCAANTSSQPDLKINGWVQRLAWTPEREQQVNTANAEIWYDAIARLADQLQANSPTSPSLQQDWAALLESVELSELATAPVVGPVEVVDN